MNAGHPLPGRLRAFAAFLSDMADMSWSVWLVLGLCLFPEAYLFGADTGFWGNPRDRAIAFDFLGFWAGLLGNWTPNYPAQPYVMFLTYGFLHAGPVHFAVNMLTLSSLGAPVAATIGAWRFLLLYLMLLIAGAIGFALFPEVHAPMVGASGALFGLAGVVLAWDMQRRRADALSRWPVLGSLAVLVVLNAVLWWAMNGQLAWQTHLGGFLAGWSIAYVMRPRN